MSLPIKIVDGKGEGSVAHVHKRNGHPGIVAYTDQLKVHRSTTRFFLNDTYGSQMAQAFASGGTPDGVHNGTDTELWTASAISGTWIFASTSTPDTGTYSIDCRQTVNGDEALFSRTGNLDMSGYTSFSGRIRINGWGSGDKHVELRFRLNGVDVGNPVNLDDYVNTTTLSVYQSFLISKEDFGIVNQDINELVVKTVKTSGSNPNYLLDNLQIEETAAPIVYELGPNIGERLLVESLVITLADAMSATLVDNSVPALSFDKLLDVPQLAIGISFQWIANGKVISSFSPKNLGEAMALGFEMTNSISDGTKTLITLKRFIPEPIVLKHEYGDVLRFTISDDLSGLLSMTACGIGYTELTNSDE